MMIHKTDEATGFLPARDSQGTPITVIGTDPIRDNFDGMCLEQAKKSRHVSVELGKRAVTEGASHGVCEALGIPPEWAERCEDSAHFGHDGCVSTLAERLELMLRNGYHDRFPKKVEQFGSYGGGNHFGEAEVVSLTDEARAREAAEVFGLRHGHIAFLSHCGSRGFGHDLAAGQFKALERKFETWGVPYPAGDKKLVYAPLGTPEANAYLNDMALGANFATVNHLLINALVLEAFQEVLPGATGSWCISSATTSRGRRSWATSRSGCTARERRAPSRAGTTP